MFYIFLLFTLAFMVDIPLYEFYDGIPKSDTITKRTNL